jgi:AcrR family transcriptional regulator
MGTKQGDDMPGRAAKGATGARNPSDPFGGRTAILAAALDTLRLRGADGLTTAAVAAAAACSKETIYRRFANKAGLLAALIEAQSLKANEILARQLLSGGDGSAALARGGAALLDLLSGEASSAIHRAAMADGSGALGRLLARNGRSRTAELFAAPIRAMIDAGELGDAPTQEIFETFKGLLLGSRQVRVLLGDGAARPRADEFKGIADLAVERLRRVFAPARLAPVS